MRIIHTRNVSIKITVDNSSMLDVRTIEVDSVNKVPMQGAEVGDGSLGNYAIDYIKDYFGLSGAKVRDQDDLNMTSSHGWRDVLADVLDGTIGSLPLIGDLYDALQLAGAVITGKDFFGRRVSRAQLMLLGAAVMLPLGISVIAARRSVKNLAKDIEYAELQALADSGDLTLLREEMTPEVREAIALDLSHAEQQQLIRATEEALEQQTTGSLKELLERIERVLGKNYTKQRELGLYRAVSEGRIPNDFLEDLSGIGDWTLQEGYNDYLAQLRISAANKGLAFRPGEAQNVIEWALNRQPRGRYNQRLVEVFGANWRTTFTSLLAVSNRVALTDIEKLAIDNLFTEGLRQFRNEELRTAFQAHRQSAERRLTALNWAISRQGTNLEALFVSELGEGWQDTLRLLRGDRIVTTLPDGVIDQLEYIVTKVGIKDHATVTEANKYFGAYLESDHLFGQEFWRNNPFIDSYDELENGAAWAVPKNAKIRNLMIAKIIAEGGVPNIPYDHLSKSRLIDELIPNGTEILFSPQQLWDVHAFVYQKLGVLNQVESNLRAQFEIFQEILENSGFSRSEVRIDFNKTIREEMFVPERWHVDPAWGRTLARRG